MAEEHTIQQGECFSSIAKEYGFLEKTLWNHPSNAALKEKRRNPNVLLPCDVVTIPDRESGAEQASTEEKHVFKAKGERVKFNLRVLKNDKPIANENYVLLIDDERIEGATDAQGWVRQPIKAGATKGKLIFSALGIEHELLLGYLDPSDTTSGIQSRLQNLGYYIGKIDGQASEDLKDALRGYQKDKQLTETGEADAATKAQLESDHLC